MTTTTRYRKCTPGLVRALALVLFLVVFFPAADGGATLRAVEAPAAVRAIAGAVVLEPGRVLAWERDEASRRGLWVFADGAAPRKVGEIEGGQIAAAAGNGAVVFVVDGKLSVTSAKTPKTPEPVPVEGEWLSVAFGAAGFVAGSAGDAFATSADGRKWEAGTLQAPDKSVGNLAALAAGNGTVAALRQTSQNRQGWGVNISEICELGKDGKTWRRLTSVEGGPQDSPLASLRWLGDRWVATGVQIIFTVTPAGKVEQLNEFEFPSDGSFGVSGDESLFRTADGWLMASAGGVLESSDLKQWKTKARIGADVLQGAWVADAAGAPLFAGHGRAMPQPALLPLTGVLATLAKAEAAAQAKIAAAKAAPPKVAAVRPAAKPTAPKATPPAPKAAPPPTKAATAPIANQQPQEPKTGMEFFKRGLERNKNYDKEGAKSDFIMAATLGVPEGALNASLFFEISAGFVDGKAADADLMQALFWRMEATHLGLKLADQREPLQKPEPAGLSAGWRAWNAKEFVAARKAFEQAAAANNAEALNALGNFHADGKGVVLDETKAKPFYQKAADLGSPFAKRRLQMIAGGHTVAATIAENRAMKKQMDSVNAMFSGEAALQEKRLSPATQEEIDRLLKPTPWTYAELVKALDEAVNLEALAVALRTSGGDYFELEKMKLINRPELRGLDEFTPIRMELDFRGKKGGGPAVRELAKKAIADRRAQLKPHPVVVDSAELREKAARGDLAALYRLSRMGEAERKLGPLPEAVRQQIPALGERAIRENYAPALWLNASALQNNTDETKVDLAKAVIYLRASAEAGEAEAAWGLAQAFLASPHYRTKEEGVRSNLLAMEHWYIEAGALAEPGQKVGYQSPEDCLYVLYSFAKPAGLASFSLYADEPGMRWARELIRRGGPAAELTKLKLDQLRAEKKPVDKVMAEIPPEAPAFSAERVKQLESRGEQGDVTALLTLADAYATGRGVLQDDAKAAALYRKAGERGDVSAMRKLADCYEKGHGLKPDKAERTAWLQRAVNAGDKEAMSALAGLLEGQAAIAMYAKAAEAGDADAWFRIADIYQYGRGGVAKDEAKLIEYATRGAEAGSVLAMERLAFFYSYQKKDNANALIWYRRAVEAGDKNSRAKLADLLKGSGDKAGALPLYLELAQEGGVRAQLQAALLLQDLGREEEAIPRFREVAAKADGIDQVTAQVRLKAYEEEKNALPGTLPYYRKRAKTGDNDARVGLALLVAKDNRDWAKELLLAAASEGHANATALYYPEALKESRAAAVAWLKTQVEKGNTQAMLFQAMELAATDKAGALALIEKAAQAGNPDAKYRQGMMQYQGQDMPQDRVAGLAKVKEAADGGFAMAQLTYGRGLIGGDQGLAADPQAGLGYLQKAAEQTFARPVAAQAALLLGQIHEQGVPPAVPKSFVKAVAFFRKASELGGANPQLDKHINEISRKANMEMKGMKPSEIK